MDVDLIRKIDYLFGVPVCFVLSLVRRVFGRNSKQFDSFATQRIAVFQISEMGSAISAYGAIDYLKQRYDRSAVYYVIFEKNKDVIGLMSQIPESQIITIREDSFFHFVADTLGVIFRLRSLRLDAAVDFELFSRFSAILSYLSGAKKRSGFDKFKMEGLYRGNLLTHKVIYNTYLHISVNFFSLVKALEEPVEDSPHSRQQIDAELVELPIITSSIDERNKMAAKLRKRCPDLDETKRIVLINPNASELLPLRRWPLENYIELTRMLLSHFDVTVVIIGLSSEVDEAEGICRAVDHGGCINFAGETSLNELIVLMNMAAVLVSNDSGPPNFASLTTVKTLVFFGPETPKLYKPLGKQVEVMYSGLACSPCVSAYNHRKSTCQDNQCLKKISPFAVFEVVQRMLD